MSAGLLLLAGGCAAFVTKHKVLVDSICAPGLPKPTGQSYRLVAKRSVVTQAQAQVQVVKACVDAALTGHGMFEPPANVAPDIFIEVTYGVDTSARVDPTSRETFLQLSARSNPEHSPDRGTGPELWDVRVGIMGVAGRMENALPLLCAVATDYMGTDTKFETQVEVPQNSPVVRSVRETAIKALEEKAAPTAPPAPSPLPETAPKPNAPTGGGNGTATASSAPAGGK
jgi:hypothetical protein